MDSNDARQLIESAIDAYFNGLRTGDSSNIPLSENVIFHSVVTGQTFTGADKVKLFVEEFAENIKSIDEKAKVIDGNNACVLFKWTSPLGLELEICEHFQFEGFQISSIRPYFDPRPLFENE
ncbi:MAG: hypothetical protein JSU67_05395 [Gammaproteobacteria bacterium]|nr:MAG: hypothetical protein JSU67_05395 [Gammaproteobacteria bacterium]